MNSVENTNMSGMSVEEMMSVAEYFSGNIDSDSDQFEINVEKFLEDPFFEMEKSEKEPIVIRPRPRRIATKNPTGKRGTAPPWKYSKRQQEKADLIEEAFKRLKGTPGSPETTGGLWYTDNDLIKAEVEKIKAERNPKVPKKRGRPPKVKTDEEVKMPKKRGRPPKVKTDEEVKIPKKRGRPPKVKVEAPPKKKETVAQRFMKQKRETVADRFRAQKTVRPAIPADSVVTKLGPCKYSITVDLNKKKPTRKAPEIPKGVAPWKPTPKPRTVLPKERPVPKPRTKLPKERPVPLPRKTKPTSPPKIRKPVKQSREVEEQPQVITPESHEIDPFGTDLKRPGHRKIETAANGAAVTYALTPQYMDPLRQMTASRQVVRGILVNELKRMGGLKYTETIKIKMSKEVGDGKTKKDSVYFKSKTGTVTNFEDTESTAAYNQLTILSRIETFQNLDSNWIILNIESHYLNIAMYKPLAGSSYMELPEDISNSMCGLINMKNDDDMCFVWSHVRHLRLKARRATTITQKDRDFELTLDYEGIEFPVKVSDIDKIERKNNINISVFGYKGKKQFYPIRISKSKYEDHMELLLLGDGGGSLHYVLIKDVNRMLCSVSKHKHKQHFCLHCLHSCTSEDALKKHRETCIEVNGVQATKLPKEGTKIKFKNHRNSMPVPFVIYADFESILVPEGERSESESSEDESSTTLYQTHKACSFGLKTVPLR